MQSFKTIDTKRYQELCSQEVPIVFFHPQYIDKVHNVEKVTKKVLTIIPKPHAHSHTMEKKQKNTQSFKTISIKL